MRLLLDENLSPRIAALLPKHQVSTVVGLGWGSMVNGKLIAAAELAGIRRMLTADANMAYQQSLAGRSFGVIVLPSNRLNILMPLGEAINRAIDDCPDGHFWFVALPS